MNEFSYLDGRALVMSGAYSQLAIFDGSSVNSLVLGGRLAMGALRGFPDFLFHEDGSVLWRDSETGRLRRRVIAVPRYPVTRSHRRGVWLEYEGAEQAVLGQNLTMGTDGPTVSDHVSFGRAGRDGCVFVETSEGFLFYGNLVLTPAREQQQVKGWKLRKARSWCSVGGDCLIMSHGGGDCRLYRADGAGLVEIARLPAGVYRDSGDLIAIATDGGPIVHPSGELVFPKWNLARYPHPTLVLHTDTHCLGYSYFPSGWFVVDAFTGEVNEVAPIPGFAPRFSTSVVPYISASRITYGEIRIR